MKARDQVVDMIPLEDIFVPAHHRPVDGEAVARLATSIEQIGMQHPITVRIADSIIDADHGEVFGVFALVAGRHRLEAVRSLGHERIAAVRTYWDETEARLWEISENLHRAELSVQERSDQIAEWVRLTAEKVSQRGTPSGGGQPTEQGIRKAAQELGLSKSSVHRAVKIADIAPEAKDAAHEAGLSNSQRALLAVAKTAKDEQVAKVHQLASSQRSGRSKSVKPAEEPLTDAEAMERWIAQGMSWWNKGSAEWREEFELRKDAPVMDQRFG